MNPQDYNWLISDIKRIKLGELKRLKSLYEYNKKFDKADRVKDEISEFNSFCNWATNEQVLNELNSRLTDYYQVLAGYYYTVAEDFEFNPLIKIDRLRKAVICCKLLKQHQPKADIYANKFICQQNRNYLN